MTNKNKFEEFSNYCNSIKYENRFFIDKKYLDYIKIFIITNRTTISHDEIFFRARIHKQNQGIELYDENNIRMPKRPIVSTSGRGNPNGINYFYVSSNMETCCSEVRPSIGDRLTVGKFKNLNSLEIIEVDDMLFSNEEVISDYYKEVYNQDINKETITEIEENIGNFILPLLYEFTRPVKDESGLEYLPYQYFVECCKNEGLHGITFRSSVMERFNFDYDFNYIFFDDSEFALIDRELKYIELVKYSIK